MEQADYRVFSGAWSNIIPTGEFPSIHEFAQKT